MVMQVFEQGADTKTFTAIYFLKFCIRLDVSFLAAQKQEHAMKNVMK